MDFWDSVLEASVTHEDGAPKFTCRIQTDYCVRTISIYLDEKSSRKAVRRKFIDGVADDAERKFSEVINRIVDDLFDRFGASGVLEWDETQVDKCNQDWTIRMLRRDLKKRGLPKQIPREIVDGILHEIYTIELVLMT